MKPEDLATRLAQAAKHKDAAFIDALYTLTDALASEGASIEAVRVILRFMESHPVLDYGTPGPLVHFVERFYRSGYEHELLESVSRAPTVHTVWMLNRMLNGAKEPVERERLVLAMQEVEANPAAQPAVRDRATWFLGRQGS